MGNKESSADRIARIRAMSEEELDAAYGPQSGSGTVNVSSGGSVVGIQAPGDVNGANVVIVNGTRVR